ncbi:MAG: molecular chaperone DnaK, partial [Bacteroidales bacterium]|nr:molecular chaperone DnaK [Bacteroidales bacterium]
AQDIEAIDAATEELNTVFQAASEEMYNAQDAGAQGAGPQDAGQQGPSEGGSDDDDVTDVDFEEVK